MRDVGPGAEGWWPLIRFLSLSIPPESCRALSLCSLQLVPGVIYVGVCLCLPCALPFVCVCILTVLNVADKSLYLLAQRRERSLGYPLSPRPARIRHRVAMRQHHLAQVAVQVMRHRR